MAQNPPEGSENRLCLEELPKPRGEQDSSLQGPPRSPYMKHRFPSKSPSFRTKCKCLERKNEGPEGDCASRGRSLRGEGPGGHRERAVRSEAEAPRPGRPRPPGPAPPRQQERWSPAVRAGRPRSRRPGVWFLLARPGGAPRLRRGPAGRGSLALPPPQPAMERPPARALLFGAAGLLLLLLPLSSSSSSDACGPCEPASCPPLPPRGCPLGETRDACGCCPMCARGEGEACGGGGAGRGYCAPGMECVKSRKRRKGKAGAAAGGPGVSGVCVCKNRYPVCGSDGNTYPTGCQLRAASLRAEHRGEKAITQVSKGTCEQGGHRRFPPRPRPPGRRTRLPLAGQLRPGDRDPRAPRRFPQLSSPGHPREGVPGKELAAAGMPAGVGDASSSLILEVLVVAFAACT